MATLLDGVNEVLKKSEHIDSDGALTSLTDTARQNWIDKAIQAINEVVDEVYDRSNKVRDGQVVQGTVNLTSGSRQITLATNLVRIRPEYHLVDRTNNHVIRVLTDPDAHAKLILSDIEQDDTGLPTIAAISPISRVLDLDVTVDAAYNGNTYTYFYEKEITYSAATDIFAFQDPVYRAVVEAAQMKYEKISARDFNERDYNRVISRAVSRLLTLPRRDTWDERLSINLTDPFERA